MRMTRSILMAAAWTALLTSAAQARLEGSLPDLQGMSKDMVTCWNATMDTLKKYLGGGGERGELATTGDNYVIGKVSGTAELQSKCESLVQDYDAVTSALRQAYYKAEGTFTPDGRGGYTGTVVDKRGILDWGDNQRPVLHELAGWYIPYCEWRRGIWQYNADFLDSAQKAPKKFEELHKLMGQADTALMGARTNCKVGSEDDIKQHIRHVARVRPIVANVQSYLKESRAYHERLFADPRLRPDDLEKRGKATLKPASAASASKLVHNFITSFLDPLKRQDVIFSDIGNYKDRLATYQKAVEPLMKETLFNDLQAFKGLRLDNLLGGVEGVDGYCRRILAENRRKYNPSDKK